MTQTDDVLTRVPPQSLDAEQSILGAILLANSAIETVSEMISADDFYREIHREIFRAMMELSDHNQPVDAITLTDALRTKSVLEQIGGPAYIAELADSVPTAANIVHYARIVREKSVLRRLITIGTDIARSGNEAGADSAALLESAEAGIFRLGERRSQSSFIGSKEMVRGALQEIERLSNHRGDVTGVPTGIRELDSLTSGLQPGDVTIIAARPSMGKSALGLNIAVFNALRANHPIATAFFSLEMSRPELMLRMLIAEARVSGTRVKAGFLDSSEYSRLAEAAVRIDGGAQIFFDDSADLTASQLRSKCRRVLREHRDIGLIIVDYLQLAQSAQRAERREMEISEISRTLKVIAKELKLPVIALSQLNRQVEMRPNKRPLLSDLRESGAIEQDADVVIFIYRDEMYDSESKDKGIAELIVRKNRNGPQTTVRTAFRPELMLFEEIGTSEIEGKDARCPD